LDPVMWPGIPISKLATRILLGASVLAIPTACSADPATLHLSGGSLLLRANFPVRRATQIIPVDTSRIEIRLTGTGIPKDAVLAAILTPERSQATFGDVPMGPKSVMAKAFDAQDVPLAFGNTAVVIVPGAMVAARVRLALLTDNGQFQLVLE
ncbi:MAG: hypothetical protein HY692_02500, partial [Cyanobacteria bacterium NC_groundwater_1444_Ag_S-0.65um_54_12]|nr:hypothetical protein [Cyanobacteria bacterium NC_groundwater_1444_Ag_S-0.65um_54_12]